MKALYDQNLPPSLITRLSDVLPGSEHVRNVGLAQVDDLAVWEFARANGFTVFSKDSDFQLIAIMRGHPPKSVRIGVGNASVDQIVQFVRDRIVAITDFDADPYASHLELR